MRMREHSLGLEKAGCCSSDDEAQQEMMTGTAIRDDIAGLHSTFRSSLDLTEGAVDVYRLLTVVVILVSTRHQILVG